jgi:hypothetical protein
MVAEPHRQGVEEAELGRTEEAELDRTEEAEPIVWHRRVRLGPRPQRTTRRTRAGRGLKIKLANEQDNEKRRRTVNMIILV